MSQGLEWTFLLQNQVRLLLSLSLFLFPSLCLPSPSELVRCNWSNYISLQSLSFSSFFFSETSRVKHCKYQPGLGRRSALWTAPTSQHLLYSAARFRFILTSAINGPVYICQRRKSFSFPLMCLIYVAYVSNKESMKGEKEINKGGIVPRMKRNNMWLFPSLALFPLDLPKMREYCKTFMAAQAVSLPPYTLESIFSLFRRYVTLSPSLSIFASVISINVCVWIAERSHSLVRFRSKISPSPRARKK